VFKVDLEKDTLPFVNNYFDLVTAIEVIEHLRTVDNLFAEVFRVLKPSGLFVLSTPNLGSWINRILLLLGYQPLYTEPSRKYQVGIPLKDFKEKRGYAGHVNLTTLKALRALLKAYNFIIVEESGVHLDTGYRILDVVDKFLAKISSLAQDVVILAKETSSEIVWRENICLYLKI